MESKCVICKKEFLGNGDVCEECIRFYRLKYKKNWKKMLKWTLTEIDRETLEDDNNDNLNSQGGKK